jgi:uroporphyrinogen III methyltransferase/synthase
MRRPYPFKAGDTLKPGIVYLIGAGPGDPGLITVKGRECLRRADVVIYDYLANPVFLREAPTAEHLYVGKKGGSHHRSQEEISLLLVEKAREGKTVARLKGGDPYIFGRGGEEALCLRRAGIPFEVVPGVTAGFAAAAYAGIPLTHRDHTTSLALITGHEDPAKKMSSLDWEKLAGAVGTLVFYMGIANLPLIARELMAHGRPADTPVAIVRWATTAKQQTLTAALGDVVEKAAKARIKPPAVIIVGAVVGLREELRWFDNRPLFGRRILNTRAADQAAELTALLDAQGAEAVEAPTIELVAPESYDELDRAIAELDSFDWLILTSANGVRCFFRRLAELGRDARALGRCRICVVGPKTAAGLAAQGLRADLVAAEFKGEGVVAALAETDLRNKKILFPKADRAREVIPTELTRLGAQVVTPVAYRNHVPAALPEAASAALEAGEIDCIAFTASSTVDNLAVLLGGNLAARLKGTAIASIGPITSKTCRAHGLDVDIEPAEYTLEALVEGIVGYFAGESPN